MPAIAPATTLPEFGAQGLRNALRAQGCGRPAATVEPLARGLLTVRAWLGDPGPLDLGQSFLIMAFQAWRYRPGATWAPGVAEQGRQLLAELQDQGWAGREPAPPPWPPTGGAAAIRQALWNHLDVLGLRTLALYQCLGLGALLPAGADPYRDFPGLVDRIGQIGRAPARTRAALLRELGGRLETGHVELDRVLGAAGGELPGALAWLRPSYAAGAGPGTLPRGLREEVLRALAARGSLRPLETLAPLAQEYRRWRLGHDPGWHWDPAVDGRELALLLFDAAPGDPGPWTAAQDRSWPELADRLYRHAAQAPGEPLPPFRLEAAGESAYRMLWRHVDHFTATFTLGLMAPGLLPSPPYPRGTPAPLRAHVERLLETEIHLLIALHEWLDLNQEARRRVLGNVAAVLAAFQPLHLGLLERVLPPGSALLEPVRFPVSCPGGEPSGPPGRGGA